MRNKALTSKSVKTSLHNTFARTRTHMFLVYKTDRKALGGQQINSEEWNTMDTFHFD